MIQYGEALEKVIKQGSLRVLGNENVLLEKSVGRILTNDIYSPEAVPSFDNSAMDGFLVRASDTEGASGTHPCLLPVSGMIAAGTAEKGRGFSQVDAPHCIEIMTGAALPESGYDAVVRIEDVLVERNSAGDAISIRLSKIVAKGENIRLGGTDFQIGQKVLAGGTRIGAHHILSCAALGITELSVRRKARFAVVSTGSELVSPGTKHLPRGMIRNSTGPYLAALLSDMDVDVTSFGIIRDSPDEYRNLLQRLRDEEYDGVISTGAVSMGKFDFISDVLKGLGAEIHFHKVAIRPGKPILFAELDTKTKSMAFFGMPGNPVATAAGCRFFLTPYLRAISGLGPEKRITARLALNSKKPEGLRCFYKARAYFDADGIQVEASKSQASYIVSALADSNSWVIFPEAGNMIGEQTCVEIAPLSFTGEFI